MYKARRNSTQPFVDITAMCDIAFVLLAFFVLISQPKTMKPIGIEEPACSIKRTFTLSPARFTASVLMGYGKVMYEIPDEQIRTQTLLQMGLKYHIKFSSVELSKFAKIEIVGVPFSQLKGYIDGYYNDRSFFGQPGIPDDPANNELADWIHQSRVASYTMYNQDIRFAIDTDKRLPYSEIENTFNILQKQGINVFELMTTVKHTNDESNEPETKTMPVGGNRSVIY